ncbi:PAS domain-containing protein [Mitsuaria sp. 7]|uniref:PAS domain-containing hybrid sensor histidine kinase/response regulator n=1 Tax=Mitsuaria sp. 7 TaxID=1658665 RepID=UPI00082C7949|nr:PAS domain-containing protein [Mitsuaria sp. 7]
MSQPPSTPSPSPTDSQRWLDGGGDMGARMRNMDWRDHPLGPLQTWPQSLRSAVSICLGSRFPMVVLWGPRLVMLYNDAYAPLLGDKHPGALGCSIHDVWTEIADVIAPLMAGVMSTGEATWIPDGYLALERHGAAEETYFSYSFGPVRVEDGSVGGILAVTMETTQRVVGERRLAFLKALDDATADAVDARDVCSRAMTVLGAGTQDVPQAALYLRQSGHAEMRVAQTASPIGRPVDWPAELTADLAAGDASGTPATACPIPCAIAVPIQIEGRAERLGTFVAVLNPQRPLDDDYRTFIALIGRQIGRSISDVNALALERARLHAEQELRRIFEQAPSFVCILKGPDHVFEFVNRAHLRLFNSAAWLGKPAREAFPDIAGQGYFEQLDEVYRTGNRFVAASAPVRYRYAPGSAEEERLLDFIYEPIRDESGRVTGVFCEGFDVTAQRRAESALAAALQQTQGQRRLYEAILANTPDLAYVFDLSHRFVYANEVLLRMWGKTWDEAIGRNCLELGYEPWHAAMHDEEIERVVATGQPVRGEVPFAGAFGRRIYDYIFVPVFGPGGEVIAVAGTTRDITEIKAMQETLRSQADQLRENDQRKDEFLGILAHELRNPLAPLKNGLEVFRRLGARDEPTLQKVQAMMDRQLVQMVRLIDDLLDVTRISSGKIRMSRSRVALAEVVQAAVETSQPAIDLQGHRLSIAAPGRPVFVDADATRLAQVFLNLLTNAAKFTAPGGHLQIVTEQQGRDVVVTVRDDGEGIPPDMLSRIFEMFVQVDRAQDRERERSGLGIGLSLARGLVELHGGSIEARSDGPGRGSAFIVRLPMAADAARPVGESDRSDDLPSLAGRRVLIADDNVDAADSLALLFELMGARPRVAHDGLDAVAQAERCQPELVLLDLGMPGLSGYEACARIKASPWGRDMVVVALTGWGQEKDRRQSREAGFDAHLVKPVSTEAIKALMASTAPAPSGPGREHAGASPGAERRAT